MNQSKKILAALVAIPASVIVAGEVSAAENTLIFNIENDFTAKVVVSKETIILSPVATNINSKIGDGINTFAPSIQFDLNGFTKGSAKAEVESVFKYLKNNLESDNSAVTSVKNAKLYGLMEKANVIISETGEGATLKSSVVISFNYLADNTTLNLLNNPNLELEFGITNGDSEVKKIKAVHDYLIKKTNFNTSSNSLNGLSSEQFLSAHSYAMWTYFLLNKFGVNTNYVYGLSDGNYHSWNIVKVGEGLYHLDVTKDEIASTGTTISYQNFLTKNNQSVILGGSSSSDVYKSLDFFKSITNSIQVGDFLYYVDENGDSEIKKLDLADITTAPETIINAATSKWDFVLDSKNNVLYFINHKAGNKLYQITTGSNEATQVVNEAIKMISYVKTSNKLTYITESGKNKEIILTDVTDSDKFDDLMINKIKIAVDVLEQPVTVAEQKNIINLYYLLTDSQKAKFQMAFPDHYREYENATKNVDEAVLNIMKEIDMLANVSQWTPEKIQSTYINYQALVNKQSEVANASILLNAKKHLDVYNDLKNTLTGFINDYGTDVKKDKDFYVKLDAIYKKYKGLEPSLAGLLSFPAVDKLKQLVEEKATSLTMVNQFVDKVKMLDESHEDYLTDVANLKPEYNTIKANTKLISLMSVNDISLMEGHISKATEWQKVVDVFAENKYMTFINTIDNDSGTLSPDPIKLEDITKADEIHDLIKDGLKQSQWKAILGSTSTLTSTIVVGKIDGLLARIKAAQSGIQNAAIKVSKKIGDFDQNILNGLKDSTGPSDYITKFTDLQTELVGSDFAGSLADFEIILSMIDPLVSSKWVKYKKIYSDIVIVVNNYNDEISDVESITDEAVLDKLIKEVNELESIYKIYLKDIEKLADAKKQFENTKYKANAQAFLNKVDALLLKNLNTSTPATYLEAKLLWDEYETKSTISTVFKKEVEGNESFKDFILVWGNLKAQNDDAEQKAKELEKLITDIQALTNEINSLPSTASIEEIADVKAKYATIVETYEELETDDKNKVKTEYEKLEMAMNKLLDKKAGESVEQLIKKIKELSDDATPLEIQALREEYDALPDELKALIPANVLKLLETFEKQMEAQLEKATKEAQPVIDRIKKIDLNKYTEAQITSIYNAYGSLSLLAKDVVMKSGAYKELMNALDHVKNQNTVVKQAKLEAGAFDEHMDKLDRNSTTAQIAAARALYNRLSYEAKKHVLTFDKLVRLETMWKDPEYIELVHTYYPDYIHAIKPGGIEITKPNYDSLYIPDDSEGNNVANYLPTEATWSSYEEMTYRSGRYMASITSSQVKNLSDRTLTLKADEIEIVLPTVDLKGTSGTVGVSVGLSNNRLTIQFTENDNAKTFSEYVEIRVPKSALNSSKYQMIERVVSNSGTAASFKVDGADFVIRTKTSGIFQGATSNVTYNDLGTSSAGNAVREFAKRGITYNTTGRSVQMTKQVTRADVATLIAKALDLSSSTKTKYQDLSSAISASRAQALQDAGIMSGVTSSRFGINTTVTKQEAAIIIANMYRYLDQDLSKAYNELKTNYTDVSNVTFEAQQSIAILELFGVVDGNGKFNPNEPLTRGQFAELLYKSLTAIDFL